MEVRRRPIGVIALLALSAAMGCADLVGADFDNLHPRSNERDAGIADTETRVSNPQANDASDEGRSTGDGALITDVSSDGKDVVPPLDPTDGGGTSDVNDGGNGRDVEYHDRHNADVSDGGPSGEDGDTPDIGDPRDAGDSGRGGGADDAIDGGDVLDGGTKPPPDGPRTTGVLGGFVSLGVPSGRSSTIELRGHFISNATLRGVTSTGISIEGKIQ